MCENWPVCIGALCDLQKLPHLPTIILQLLFDCCHRKARRRHAEMAEERLEVSRYGGCWHHPRVPPGTYP